ncbi:MAG: NifU family protein [Campylobacterota bacterium]|nr:NifU family protein [Campylobacterota bacterium]
MIPFSDEEIYDAVKNNLPKVSQYVNSHGGDIRLLGVKNAIVYIELTGTCHGCAMSLMTTKMVVRRELRELIHPELDVVNVDGTEENELPEEYYTQEAESSEEESGTEKAGFMDKVKNMFG